MAIDLGKGWKYPLAPNPSPSGKGGIKTAQGEEHLRQSILLILMTPKGSRVMRPWFGSNLYKHIDSPINQRTIAAMRYEIYEALKEETRGRVSRIRISNPEPQWIVFDIEYLIENEIKIAVRLSYNRDMNRWQEGLSD